MNKQQATFDDFFSECYLKYKEYIKNYIAIRICHPHEAEDLAQDVFVRLWEHRAFVNKDTVWSVIYDLKNKKIYRVEGNPSRKKFIEDKRFKLD